MLEARTRTEGTLRGKMRNMNYYTNCNLCPRSCGVNRLEGEKGYCKETSALRVGAALLHCGEEPPLVGGNGSGTIFISGCNLMCEFCQNYQISQPGVSGEALGKEVSPKEFAEICLALRGKGAANINIVTGSHAIPAIAEGLDAAKNAGLDIPVLWNSSAYENTEALDLLKDCVDIYLPDLKTLDSALTEKYFNAPEYPQTAVNAILKMCDLTNKKENVIIRHLVLPGCLESTLDVLRWFSHNVKDRALLSLMTQYTPIPGRVKHAPKRYLLESEYETVMRYLEELEIEDGFCQELVTGNDWLPDFTRINPFSSALSVPVWHYSCGFTAGI